MLLWTIISTKLTGVIHSYVAEVLTKDKTSLELEELVPPSVTSLTYAVVRELNPGKRIRQTLMNEIMSMFAKRESLISQQYANMIRKKSKYCPIELSNYLISNEALDIARIRNYFLPQENILTAYTSLYFAFELCELDSWCLLYVNLEKKCIQFIDSQRRRVDELGALRNTVDHMINRLNSVLHTFHQENNILNFNDWEINNYPCLLFQPQQNDFDSGIIIAGSIYFISLKAPIYFNDAILQEFRMNFAHWLIKDKSLPL